MRRVILRAFELEDYKLINVWRNDDDVTALLGGNKIFVSSERERRWVEEKAVGSPSEQFLSICLANGAREMIGYLSLVQIEWRNRQAEWGGLIIGRKDLWGQGLATEAADLMLSFAFMELNLNRVYGRCIADHAASLKMFHKLGLQQEGLLRQAVYKDGRYYDVATLGIIRDEYLARQG